MSTPIQTGPVRPDFLYPLSALQTVTGLGSGAFRQMRRKGLKVRYVAGRAYVLGSDFINHVVEYGKSEKDAPE